MYLVYITASCEINPYNKSKEKNTDRQHALSLLRSIWFMCEQNKWQTNEKNNKSQNDIVKTATKTTKHVQIEVIDGIIA